MQDSALFAIMSARLFQLYNLDVPDLKFKHIPQEDAKKRVIEICKAEKLDVEPEAIDAVFKLCEGDMRKVVNMLQSISISQSSALSKQLSKLPERVDASYIYNLTGNIHPDDIDNIFNTLLTEELTTAFATINSLKVEKGISLNIILKELTLKLMEMDMPSAMKSFLIQRMGDLEYRASLNCSEKIQLGSLVGAFVESRTLKQSK